VVLKVEEEEQIPPVRRYEAIRIAGCPRVRPGGLSSDRLLPPFNLRWATLADDDRVLGF
jgi:hypothetical protein